MTKYQMLIEILAVTISDHYKPSDRNSDESMIVKHIGSIMEYDDGGGWNAPPDKSWFQSEENSKKLHRIMQDIKDVRQEHEDSWEPDY